MKDIISRINTLLGYPLPIENDEDLLTVFDIINTQHFDQFKLEKDFYLTVLLHWISREIPQIRFKGGTCLNKVYFPYFRLSEDLDFTISIQDDIVNSNSKREAFAHNMRTKMKEIGSIMNRILNPDATQHAKAQGNTIINKLQYTYLKYILTYPSIFDHSIQTIKIELSYTNKQHLSSNIGTIQDIFVDSVTENPIFPSVSISCLSLEEMMAEKMRAALTRQYPAIRDFFDIWYVHKQGFNFDAIRNIITSKIEESGSRYTIDIQYDNLNAQIYTDLKPVLGKVDGKFNLEKIYAFILTFKKPDA